jgi:hypothetical protein
MASLGHQLVDVEDADARRLDSRVAAEDAFGPNDFGHRGLLVRVRR